MKAVVDSCGWLEYIANGSNASFFEAALQNEAQLLVPQSVVFEVEILVEKPFIVAVFAADVALNPKEVFVTETV